ncbi:peptidoglycan editing factor PgeF [Sulfurimonas sp.]|uniref:peptidoglycan editing factor PgeF n=1 Tax=Sulfurimonas sp. TaxID=2022749 RepID=UPI003569081E
MSLYQSKFFFTSKEDGNLAFHVGDDELKVINNHQILSLKHSYDLEKLVHMKQIHSDIVHIIDEKDNFENPPTCDALITNKKHTPLMVMVADCTPVLFFDEIKGVIAVAHAGRQGAFKNIVKNVLDSFVSDFNSDIKNIKVSIGASICTNCYEVGDEIDQEAKDLNLSYAIERIDEKFYLDVNKIILNQLHECGIKDQNIELTKKCSSCDEKEYYSYRREGQTGRFAGVIILN